MSRTADQHYDKKYFKWQKKIGEFGGKANLFKFEKYICSNDVVLDFGCGGAYLLQEIECKKKYGVEINETARKEARNKGIICKANVDDIPADSIDVIISNHCLEHVTNPYDVLVSLKRVLKKSGKIIFVVPNENSFKVREDDVNMHLYTWNPQHFRNLFTVAGYEVVEADSIKHKWPPYYWIVQKLIGWKLFHVICKIWCQIRRHGYQTRVVAVLPGNMKSSQNYG